MKQNAIVALKIALNFSYDLNFGETVGNSGKTVDPITSNMYLRLNTDTNNHSVLNICKLFASRTAIFP